MGADDHKNVAEQWLDAALKRYGEAEPRVGIEGRVLANLRAERERVAARRSWWPVWAAVTAMVLAFLAIGNHGASKEIATVRAPVMTEPEGPARLEERLSRVASKAQVQKKSVPRRPVGAREVAEPFLEQFPALRPLTRQEQLLARYVQERPEEAKRKAQVQADLFEEDLAEFEKQPAPSERGQTKDKN